MKRYHATMIVLAAATVVALAGCSLCGAAQMGWHDLWRSDIFWHLRLPREVLALAVGAVLAVSGTGYQSVFRNPLTDPYLLGVSSGASLGAAAAIVAGIDIIPYGVEAAALVAGLLTVGLITRISSSGGRIHSTTLLLTGVCLTLLISAVVSFLMVMHHDKMERIIFWTMGSLSAASWSDVTAVGIIAVAGIATMRFYAKDLNLMLMGSEAAQSMGVDVDLVKKIVLGVTTLMVAVAVASCGVIGFVGLIVPHAVRLVVGSDNRRVLPASALAGGLLLLLCDTAARSLFQPAELPIGSLTALIGAPLFIFLILRKRYK